MAAKNKIRGEEVGGKLREKSTSCRHTQTSADKCVRVFKINKSTWLLLSLLLMLPCTDSLLFLFILLSSTTHTFPILVILFLTQFKIEVNKKNQ